MPVFLVKWETEGCIPVEAATPEEAKKLAEKEWRRDIANYSEYDINFGKPEEVKCLEEAFFIDDTLHEVDGDCSVAGSKKSLKDILPSDPNYTNPFLEKMKKYKDVAKTQ